MVKYKNCQIFPAPALSEGVGAWCSARGSGIRFCHIINNHNRQHKLNMMSHSICNFFLFDTPTSDWECRQSVHRRDN